MGTLNNIKPAFEDIDYYNNDVFDLSVIVTDENGDAVDLSAKDLVFTIKRHKTSTVDETLTTASGISISGTDSNVVTFNGDFDLEERSYYYDLHNTTDNETIMYGRFNVVKETHE